MIFTDNRISAVVRSAAVYAAALFSVVFLCSCSDAEQASAAEDYTKTIVIESETTASVSTAAAASETTAAEVEIEPENECYTVTFTALGDNLIHSSIYKQAARRAKENGLTEARYDFSYAYSDAEDLFNSADITILNQETLICNDIYEPSTYPFFNSPTELGLYMAELGVDVFTIANNHTLDKGTDGLSACLDFYDENNLIRVGAYRDAEDRSNIRTIESNGVTVSFLAYTEYLNGLSLPESSPLEIGMAFETEVMIKEIQRAKEISDICIVSLHWGVEDSDVISDNQRTLAAQLGEAGADVIIGNHPHVLRSIELMELSDGRQLLCAYSLGNLISAQSVGKNLIGGTLDFSVTVYPDDSGHTEISNIKFNPLVTHYEGSYSNVRLYRLENYTEELAAAHGVNRKSEFGYDYIYDYLESHGLTETPYTDPPVSK